MRVETSDEFRKEERNAITPVYKLSFSVLCNDSIDIETLEMKYLSFISRLAAKLFLMYLNFFCCLLSQ